MLERLNTSEGALGEGVRVGTQHDATCVWTSSRSFVSTHVTYDYVRRGTSSQVSAQAGDDQPHTRPEIV